MQIVVAIASLGRAQTLRSVVDRLADQTRRPDKLILAVTCAADVAGIEGTRIEPHILLARKGSCSQRNAALDEVADPDAVVVFFDDDFVPANDYLEQVEQYMLDHPEVGGITGALVDDGIHGEPIAFEDAVNRLDVAKERPNSTMRERKSLYGCNMAVRLSAAPGVRFDENLPLYGWQEDTDYTHQFGQRSRLVSGPQFTGIHLGVRGGRQPGTRVGYSQIANVVYLLRKGTMRRQLGWRLLFQNVASNLVRSAWPERGIDRRGRLRGNIMALKDCVTGTVDPRKVQGIGV